MSSAIKDLIYGLTSDLAEDKYVPGGYSGIAQAADSPALTQEEVSDLLGSALYFLDRKVKAYRETRQLLDHIFVCINEVLQKLEQAYEKQDWLGAQNAAEQLTRIAKIKDELRDN